MKIYNNEFTYVVNSDVTVNCDISWYLYHSLLIPVNKLVRTFLLKVQVYLRCTEEKEVAFPVFSGMSVR